MAPSELEARLILATDKISDAMSNISANTTQLSATMKDLNDKFILHDCRAQDMERSLREVVQPLLKWFAAAVITLAAAWVGGQLLGLPPG